MADTSSEECPTVSPHCINVLIQTSSLEIEEQSSELGASAATSDNSGATVELEESEDSSPEDNLDTLSIQSYEEDDSASPSPAESGITEPPVHLIQVVYQFEILQTLVGLLIGRGGRFVNHVKEATNTSIIIREHPGNPELKVCSIRGTRADIDKALDIIRNRFPTRSFPSVTLEEVSFEPPVPFSSLRHQVKMRLGQTNHVRITNLVSAGHFFLQLLTHPTFRDLHLFNVRMSKYYNETATPFLPTPIKLGMVCSAPTVEEWRRAMIVRIHPNSTLCDVKFLDYGGYSTYDYRVLHQLIANFTALPYQAVECYLANVAPVGGKQEWSKEAFEAMEELTKEKYLRADVCGFTGEGIPITRIYEVEGSKTYVNRALVDRGLAQWFEPPPGLN